MFQMLNNEIYPTLSISIITVVKNNEKNILGCMDSFNSQLYENKQHLIIDGISTDETTNIIKKNLSKKVVFYCEKDNGIYDALNKGIRYSSGEIIGILHSDDF